MRYYSQSASAVIFWENIGPKGRAMYLKAIGGNPELVNVQWQNIPDAIRSEIGKEMNTHYRYDQPDIRGTPIPKEKTLPIVGAVAGVAARAAVGIGARAVVSGVKDRVSGDSDDDSDTEKANPYDRAHGEKDGNMDDGDENPNRQDTPTTYRSKGQEKCEACGKYFDSDKLVRHYYEKHPDWVTERGAHENDPTKWKWKGNDAGNYVSSMPEVKPKQRDSNRKDRKNMFSTSASHTQGGGLYASSSQDSPMMFGKKKDIALWWDALPIASMGTMLSGLGVDIATSRFAQLPEYVKRKIMTLRKDFVMKPMGNYANWAECKEDGKSDEYCGWLKSNLEKDFRTLFNDAFPLTKQEVDKVFLTKGSGFNALVLGIIAGAGGALAYKVLRKKILSLGIDPISVDVGLLSAIGSTVALAGAKRLITTDKAITFITLANNNKSDMSSALDNFKGYQKLMLEQFKTGERVSFNGEQGIIIGLRGNYATIQKDDKSVERMIHLKAVMRTEDVIYTKSQGMTTWNQLYQQDRIPIIDKLALSKQLVRKTWRELPDIVKTMIKSEYGVKPIEDKKKGSFIKVSGANNSFDTNRINAVARKYGGNAHGATDADVVGIWDVNDVDKVVKELKSLGYNVKKE